MNAASRLRTSRTFETIVELIGHTRTAKHLRVKAKLDKRSYNTGVKSTKTQMSELKLSPDKLRGEWNYELFPRNLAIELRSMPLA